MNLVNRKASKEAEKDVVIALFLPYFAIIFH
jgi:hypothetical protein